jgi:hypothetical protein
VKLNTNLHVVPRSNGRAILPLPPYVFLTWYLIN